MEQQKSFVWYFSHIPVAICALISFCFVNTIGRIQYRSKYLKGKWFQHWYSEGWRRAFRYFWSQAVFRSNGHIPWPVNSRMIVSDKIMFLLIWMILIIFGDLVPISNALLGRF